jgi:hypothetical protein
MVEDEAFKALMAKLGERIQYMSGEAFEKFGTTTTGKWGRCCSSSSRGDRHPAPRGATTWPTTS